MCKPGMAGIHDIIKPAPVVMDIAKVMVNTIRDIQMSDAAETVNGTVLTFRATLQAILVPAVGRADGSRI